MNKGKAIFAAILLTGAVMCGNVIKTDIEKEDIKCGAMAEAQTGTIKVDKAPAKEYAVPYGDTSFKSYMDYRAITNHESAQWILQKKCTTDKHGLRRYGDDYVIAVGSYYSKHIGERITVTLDTGESFTAVVGDLKADKHTDSSNRYTLIGDGRKNVIEFVVDSKCLDRKAKLMGDISYIEGFDGNVTKIVKEN